MSDLSDRAWYDSPHPHRSSTPVAFSSCYLTMRDGVRIALNVWVPERVSSGTRLPTILHQTRYYRSMELRQPLRALTGGRTFEHIPPTAKSRKRFVANGYAWVDVDVRGSGASYGNRACEWSPDEIRDGAEVVDWIIRQPWSNGRVGGLGTSYDGACAEFLLVNRHPAVRAIAPRFALFDAYTDIAFPGGIHAAWFTESWGRYNDALDRNAPHEVAGWWVKALVTGVQPVQDDRDRSLRAGAIAAHRDNYDVHDQARTLTFRDDVAPSDPYHNGGNDFRPVGTPIDESGSINLFSPHNYWHDTEASGAAVYSYGGWFDGAYAHAAIKRFLTVSTGGSRLILGPWNHGGRWHIDPFADPRKSAFDHDGEVLRFFDHHLKDRETEIDTEPVVHYFTMGENRWKSSDVWPPPAITRTYYLSSDRELGLEPPSSDTGAGDEYTVDRAAGTGERSRWRTQVAIGVAVRYADRSEQDSRLLSYTSAPLDRAVEVTGHPLVRLFVSSTAEDGAVFVYVEDVDPHGRVGYVTEGQLRLCHRLLSTQKPAYRQVVPYRTFNRADSQRLRPDDVAELTFDLLPTSHVFDTGHRIRVAVAGADASHFALVPDGPSTLYVHRSRHHPSRIELPIVDR